MTVRFQCECGKKLKASDDKIGKKILCSDCGQPVTIPARDTVAVEHVLMDDMEDEPAPKSSKSSVSKKGKPKSEVSKDAVSNYAAELMRDHEAETRRRNSSSSSASATNLLGQKAATPAKPTPEKERAQIDWAGTFRQVGPWAIGTVVLCLGAWYLGDLLFGYKPTLPDLAPVSGFVMLDGKPVADVEVTFMPVIDHRAEPDPKKVPPADSVARTDGTGKYVLIYTGELEGAAVGPHKVTLRSTNFDKGAKQVPAVYGNSESSPLMVEVKPGGDDKMNFDLSSSGK